MINRNANTNAGVRAQLIIILNFSESGFRPLILPENHGFQEKSSPNRNLRFRGGSETPEQLALTAENNAGLPD